MEYNTEEIPSHEPSFVEVEVNSSQNAREEFLKTHEESLLENEKTEALDKFIAELQQEADIILPGPERDLWFNLQLTKVFMDAKRWEDALEAVEDAQIVATNMQEGEGVFNSIREEILVKLHTET